MENIKPVRPDEVFKQEETVIHPSMIRAINLLLTRFNGQSVTITVDELVEQFMKFEPSYSRLALFDTHQLDFEGLYGEFGWNVVYERPARDENFEPYYTFKPKPKNYA